MIGERMTMKRTITILVVLSVGILPLAVLSGGLPSWRGDGMAKWTKGAHQIADSKYAGGAVTGRSTGSDPFWTIGHAAFAPTATQEVLFRGKSPVAGLGEIYWTPAGARQPTPQTRATFKWIGDGKWHEYRVRPFWQGGGDIKALRFDFPQEAVGKGEIGLADIRIVDELTVRPVPLVDVDGVSFTCVSVKRGKGVFEWVSDGAPGVMKKTFSLMADGRAHHYYLTFDECPGGKANLVWHRFVRQGGDDPLEVSSFRICSDEPEIPADLVVQGVHFVTPACRVGTPGRIEASVRNLGLTTAEKVSLRVTAPPDGVVCVAGKAKSVAGDQAELLALDVRGSKPFDGMVRVEIVQADAVVAAVDVPVRILPSLGLSKVGYVPEPKPPKCDYEIGALYYPGWERAEAWKRVWQTCPERRPVLGWYDETSPEVVDWQIKWLSENGIGALYVDWYWHRGHRHHEHWIQAFQKAKWRKYLKWAMMWANHTPAGAHSVEDQRAATQYWIEHYFNTPEYLTRDGKPVVWIWQGKNMDRDLGAGGCRKLLDLSRRMAVEAGYKGIHFIAMKWPEDVCTAEVMQSYKDMGFDEVGIYHFMGHDGKATVRNRYAYSLVADANPSNWWRQQEAKVMPFLPNLSTGWDDRPWNDHCEIYGKNAADFRRICQEAKKFADRTGVKRLCLAPLNEWGEGSYAEPNAEHGFDMYEAVRETFCEKPAAGWPQNLTPADVGLGPYDLPLPEQPSKVTDWNLTDGSAQGWRTFMGCMGERCTGEGLAFETSTRDPAMSVSFALLKAGEFKTVTVRVRLENAKGRAVLFWARQPKGMRGDANVAVPVVSDGEFHDYVFKVGDHKRWKGRIGALRFDPCENPGAKVTVASIRLD